MPLWLEAGLWGLLSGGALVLGAAIGYAVRLPARMVAGVMAFGAGVLISGLAALAGYTVFRDVSAETQAATTALAAGAILAMLMDTMIPEACEGAHNHSGLIGATGFLCAFARSVMGT